MSEKNETFEAVRWLASEVLLRQGTIERLLNEGVEVVMDDCPCDDLTLEQLATIEALLGNERAVDALISYWDAYTEGRHDGSIPSASSNTDNGNPWLG